MGRFGFYVKGDGKPLEGLNQGRYLLGPGHPDGYAERVVGDPG